MKANSDKKTVNQQGLTNKLSFIKKHPVSVMRTISRVLFFFALPSLYIFAYLDLIDILIYLRDGKLTLEAVWPSLISLLAIIPVTIIGGRFFCGFMCSFGAVTDVFYQIGHKIFKRWIRLPKRLDLVLRYFKYFLLLFLVVSVWMEISVAEFSPWDAFGMLFTVGSVPNLSLLFRAVLPGGILLLLILAASFFIERFFCRYLCPIGAVFAAVSAGRQVRIEKQRDKCGKCQACTRACPMGIDLSSMDVVRSVECIDCMRCIEICPRQNTHLTIRKKRIPERFVAVLSVVLISSVYLTMSQIRERSENIRETLASETEVSEPSIAETTVQSIEAAMSTSDQTRMESETEATMITPEVSTPSSENGESNGVQSPYLDGVYQGNGEGFRGEVTVEITILEGRIQEIAIISYADDDKYFEKASREIVSGVLAGQDGNVDAVSGATYSSQGLLEAIQDALSKASLPS